jgi:hypothetical protein
VVFGNCSEFAIEFELNDEYGGVWLFGKFCYWIKGMRIGDYELGTSLRDVLFQMKNIMRDKGDRSNKELYALDFQELFNRLNGAFYDYDISLFYKKSIEETWARFNVTIPVDIFDGWKVYLIEGFKKSRIIFKTADSEDIIEETLEPGSFDDVFIKVYDKLNKLYEDELNR